MSLKNYIINLKRFLLLIAAIFLGLMSCKSTNENSSSKDTVSLNDDRVIIFESTDSLAIRRVKVFPHDILNRKELRYLSIIGQDCDITGMECFAITSIPSEIDKLENLEELYLPLNYITKLPHEILNLKQLEVLDLSDNPGFADVTTLQQMNWLKEFYCYGCQLSDADIKALKMSLPDCIIGIE